VIVITIQSASISSAAHIAHLGNSIRLNISIAPNLNAKAQSAKINPLNKSLPQEYVNSIVSSSKNRRMPARYISHVTVANTP
jgi:hypothetical protein